MVSLHIKCSRINDHTAAFEYKETVFYTLLGLNTLDILLINCGYLV